MEPWHIWLIIALILFIAEIVTSGFAAVCLSIGAVIAAISVVFGLSITWQIVVFAVASVIALVYIRPALVKMFGKSKDERKSGVDALIGREAIVTERIDYANHTGRVSVDGDDWKAVTPDNQVVEAGQKVTILQINSIILTVQP